MNNYYHYFISHSAKESRLAKLFYNYLATAMGIPKELIFCSSINQQIPFGTNDYLKYIHDALIATKNCNGKYIALISSEFMRSNFCKYEVGAAWALDIEMKPILFPPISYDDSQITGSPMARTQSLRIDKSNLHDTAYMVLRNLAVDGERDDEIRKYIVSVSRDQQFDCINSTSNAIVELLSGVETNCVKFDVLAPTGGIYHADGLSHTMSFERDVDEQQLILNVDFSINKPAYVGYYIRPLTPKNWSPYIENKFFIRFDATATTEMGLYIELKCKDYQITDKLHRIAPNTWNTYSFYLGNMSAADGWSDMKEVCFVIKPNCIESKGTIRIKNLRLEREPLV